MYEFEFEAQARRAAARRPARPKRHRAVVEIKPDTRAGRQAGLEQLARPDRQLGLPPRLVVYSKSGPRSYTIKVSRPGAAKRALGAAGGPDATRLTSFETIGTVSFTEAEWKIDLSACPTELGRRIEQKACELYRRKVGGGSRCKVSASANGPDYVSREAAEFYLELAQELAAELEAGY
ncbi:hypothetical protein [Nocardioides cavernaquae]|uniref:Uncharacterized protein n=1 Tax=Nocardioides cavernaquae TaxID=2321396 RepID=A0A3A5HB27_9ACTN|nr:hypothetical protein [Nocardioides cavernaquae]RJS47281.1 hypothetical protein D4739_14325 [Nocardioides cavernaquae]